jgi:CHAD domain-containing protein
MMVRKRKWLADVSPDEPLEDVARRALEARLALVWHYLPRAAEEPEEMENVHLLRVSTRRAMAALQIFDALLPMRRAVWMNKQLKRIRQAAGNARDLDVLAERLKQRIEDHGEPSRQLVKYVERLRAAAQKPIEKSCRKLERRDFCRRQEAFVERVRLHGKADQLIRPTFGQAARRSLTLLVEDFFSAAAADFSDYAALHAFRIQGKQLRYAMEIFAGACDRALRDELYPVIELLQEKLGRINDHATAGRLFADWLADPAAGDAAEILPVLLAEEAQALDACRQEFFRWWTADRASQLRRRFAELLDAGFGRTA